MPHEAEALPATALLSVPVERIRRDETQARRVFDEGKLAELAASIRHVGILEPLELRPDPDHEGHYIIVYGERRWRAAQIAGLTVVPAMVKSARDTQRRQLYENVARVDLNIVELAANVVAVMTVEHLETKQLAEQLAWPLRKVQRLIEIHEAPEIIKSAIISGLAVDGERRWLSHRHALDIVRAFRHFAKSDKTVDKQKALVRTEKLVNRVLSEEWPAQRLQDFVAALGRGKRIRDEDLEVVRSDASPMERGLAQGPDPLPKPTPAPRLFERSERRFVLHLDRARACSDAGLRSELGAAIRELASEFAGG